MLALQSNTRILFPGLVGDAEEVAGAVVCAEQTHDLLEAEGAGAAEDGDLVAALVHGPVEVGKSQENSLAT